MGLCKEFLETWNKRRWLKAISKEVDRYNRIGERLNMQGYVVNEMLKKYNEIYGEDLRAEKRKLESR